MSNRSISGSWLVLVVTGALFLVNGGNAWAQTSPSFELEEQTFNGGGTPSLGTDPSSASFSITLSSLGEGASAGGSNSSSFALDSGFPAFYPPPGEVAPDCGLAAGSCLVFTSSDTLTWPAESSPGGYNLYRDLITSLAGLGFGQCEQPNLSGPTAVDSDPVPAGDGFFYLVTAENRLGEEGTKGFQGTETPMERTGTVCP